MMAQVVKWMEPMGVEGRRGNPATKLFRSPVDCLSRWAAQAAHRKHCQKLDVDPDQGVFRCPNGDIHQRYTRWFERRVE